MTGVNRAVITDMSGRAFCVKVHLQVHAVTCPGVWLCPNGKVALQINALDSCAESRRISPIFPLLFHERFTFSKVFARIVSLAELQRTLEQEFLQAKLTQWATPCSRGITLATFETNLADLLYPEPSFKGLLAGVDIDLLMEPTKCFPGIIAPKIEVSTKTVVEEVLGYDTYTSKCYVVNPKMINSKQTTCGQKNRPTKGIIRQRRVCHAKSKPRSQSCRPYRPRSSSVGDSHQCPSCNTCYHIGPQLDQCYHATRKDFACTSRLCSSRLSETVAVCDSTHVTDNCPVCFKYNCYFSKCHDDSDIAQQYFVPEQRCRRLSDARESYACLWKLDSSSDTQEDNTSSCRCTVRSQIRNLQKIRKTLSATEAADNVDECNPSCRFVRNHASSHEYYKDLEKFYKKMYKQAKIRAQEVNG